MRRNLLKLAALAFLAVFITACGDGYEDGLGPAVRIVNNHSSTTFNVQIGPSDFGDVAPGETTEYMAINAGDNHFVVNGEVREPLDFYTGSVGSSTWTYTFTEFGYGFALDR